ncbi:MAG: serine/threonine-protein kinase [Polyangiaceae bacterium]
MSTNAHPDLHAEAPAKLGRYELIHQLGAGGMARVYLAVQRGPVAAKLVVVKCLRDEYARDPQFVAQFVDESRVLVRLNHPNVIHTYEASSEGDDHYIVMEFLEGKTLGQLLEAVGRPHMPLGLHLWLLCEVLAGLRYAHELRDFDGSLLGIVHRDVSPSNVFLTRSGTVKLLDFGIATVSSAVSATDEAAIIGSIGYASPEQCLGLRAHAPADLYSVGIMLWEAIAGRRRAVGETAEAKVQARVLDRESDIAEVTPDVAPELAEIVRRALAFDTSLRYQTAATFHADLSAYVARLGAAQSQAPLADLVVAHFGDQLARVRRVIGDSVRVGSESPMASSEMLLAAGARATANASPSQPTLTETSAPEARRSPRPRKAITLAAGALALLMLGFAYQRIQPAPPAASTPTPLPTVARQTELVTQLAASTATSAEVVDAKGSEEPSVEPRTGRAHRRGEPARVPPTVALAITNHSSPEPKVRGNAPPAPGELEPGNDLRGVYPALRAQRSLDDRDPY